MSNLRSFVNLTFKTKVAGVIDLNSIVNKEILSVVTHKDLSSPMGNFSILLSPRVAKNLAVTRGTQLISDIIKPFDLVQIQFKTDGGYKTEMIGVVSRATGTLNIDQSGKPSRAIRIDGYDLGKVIQSFKLFFNPYVKTPSGQEFGGQFYFGKDHVIFNNLDGSPPNPKDFISKFLSYTFNKTTSSGPFYPLLLGDQKLNVVNYIDFVTGISTEFKNHTMSDPFILLGLGAGQEVSVYDIIKAYSDPPFHETFIDLRRAEDQTSQASVEKAEKTHTITPKPSKTFGTTEQTSPASQQPYVFYMRTTPFSLENWNTLSQHQFLQTDVIHQDTAVSEDNIFNYYMVTCERENIVQGNIQVSQIAATTSTNSQTGIPRIPIFDNKDLIISNNITYPASIDSYGMRRFPTQSTKYVEFIKYADYMNNEILKKQASLARELFRWFSFGELMESGTIVLKGRTGISVDGATIGSRLIETSSKNNPTGKEYYIEGVMQEWVSGQPFKTTLSVTRGHFPFKSQIINGINYPGRFSLVKQQEKNLQLDQEKNGSFFENIPF